IREYTGLIPKMDLLSLINIEWVIRKLEAMAKKMDVQEPWSHPRANEFDAQSLDAFVKAKCFRADAYKILSAGLETVFACMLNEISLLHALFYIRSGSSLNILLSIEKGAQQHRLKGGMQNLAEQMAKAFAHQIKYNHAVTKITQEKNKVIVAGERFSYEADKVILAVPPVLLADMAFHPPLPKDKIQVIEKIFMGNVGKVFGVYAKPFWRDKGFSGQVVADELGPFQTLFDLSPADGSCGILLAFCLAGRAEDFFSKSEAKRKEIATQYFQKYFGEEANQMLSYHDHTWRYETWSRGCFAGIYPPNTWTNHQNALAAVYGNIHWAGTETADVWYGYIEGAVRAGERAAKEILSSI
ncbi:MAG TPA: FAD-dependent oxidoreductase, partial [Cyclobacteriaceae bacterium]|nr:FAD-dependent oxidoreductase [Cyclobacteriaceae bacterium]